MAASDKRSIEVVQQGLDIMITGQSVEYSTTAIPKYYSLCTIKSVEANMTVSTHLTPFTDKLEIVINYTDTQGLVAKLAFDIQDVTNQAGWTADQAGLTQAVADISTWKESCSSAIAIGDIDVNTDDIEGLLTDLQTITAHSSLDSPIVTSAAATLAAGGYSALFHNVGAAAGTVNGVTLPVGASKPYTAAFMKSLPGIPYDATGTTFNIEVLKY